MQFFCYHRDRVGSTGLRTEMVEEHWSYMDRFEGSFIARGPTFAGDETLTGSVHIIELPDAATARAFAFDEPCYQAGAYRDVLLRRWQSPLRHTMWDTPTDPAAERYLVLGFTPRPEPATPLPAPTDDLIAFGALLSDDGTQLIGAAALVEAAGADEARAVLPAGRFTAVEVHSWDLGGRRT